MLVARARDLLARTRLGRGLLLLVANLELHSAPTAASSMAFDAFLSLVPLFGLAGYFLNRPAEQGDLLIAPLLESAPLPVRQLVDAEFLRLSESGAAIVAPVSIAAFLWVSSAGLSTAMGVFEVMFHSPARPWWLRRFVAMCAVIAGFIVLLGIVTVGIFVSNRSGSLVLTVLTPAVPVLVIFGLLCAFFRIAIRGARPLRRRIIPGAIITLLLWAAASAGFSLYVATLSRYATLYGSLAAAAIFLFWLWLLSLSLLVGGEVNAQLEGVRSVAPPSIRRILPTIPERVGPGASRS